MAGALLTAAWLSPSLAAPAWAARKPEPAAVKPIRVPQDVRDLQSALSKVRNGGVVIVAPGVYTPPAGKTFRVNGPKTITVRSSGPGVVLDGQGTRQILRIEGAGNKQPDVTFQGITFRGGSTPTLGGAVFLRQARATFRNCAFADNTAGQQGGAILALDARLVLERTTLLRNRVVGAQGAGGAVSARRTHVVLQRSRFEGNRAGWVGGAIYAYGDYRAPADVPTTLVEATGTDFVGNSAEAFTCCAPGATFGGALHGEDQATLRITGSRLVGNRAQGGGGVSLYRAHGEVRDSVLRGNTLLPGGASGPALLLLSSDFADGSTAGGTIDRPPASLIAERALFQGAAGPGAAPPPGGCVNLIGDNNSLRGLGGVPARGTAAGHRAPVALKGVVFAHCSGVDGGALSANLVELSVVDSLFLGSRASSDGGAVMLSNEAAARFVDTTFAGNSAGTSGGAVRASGSHLEVHGGAFLDNSVGGGFDPGSSRGAALFTAPSTTGGRASAATGLVQGALFAGGGGLPIYEQGGASHPGNGVRYDGNRFFGSSFGSTVFFNSLAGPRTVFDLNATDKSQVDNQQLFAAPAFGALRAVPSHPLVLGPNGVVEPAWLAYGWTGSWATIGGGGLPARHGLLASPAIGEWTLAVDGAARATARVSPPS